MHSADVVLFVTTPEKYKTMQAAQWVAQQRRQRAMAFVLNKWDRDGIGLQYDCREVGGTRLPPPARGKRIRVASAV